MRYDDAPEKWQARLKKPAATASPPKVSLGARIAMFVLFVCFIAGGFALYVLVGRETGLGETLPLPKPLKTVSAAHEDLQLYGRELNELASEAGGRFTRGDKKNFPIVVRMLDRIDRLHKIGRDLEPKVTREEHHALTAFENGEKLLGDFIQSASHVDGSFDPSVVKSARMQIDRGMALLSARKLGTIVADEAKHLDDARHGAVSPVQDVKAASEHLRLGVDDE